MIQAHFSQIRHEITQYIENSKSEICIAVAWFTHRDLFYAISRALDRNVKVSVILIDDIINRGPNGLDFATLIAQGIIAFLEGNSFEEVIRLAISLGGDSDTIGCMAGAIAACMYPIPNYIAERCNNLLTDDLREIKDQFLEMIGERDM